MDETPERFQPHAPPAQSGVPVDAAAPFAGAIVQMPDADPAQPDRPVQGFESCIVLPLPGQGIARREEMARVHAHSQPLRVADALEDGGQVLEAMSQAGPLAGGRFEIDPDSRVGGALDDRIESLGDAIEAGLFPAPIWAPGWATRSAMPRAWARSISTSMAAIERFQRASSGLARLMR